MYTPPTRRDATVSSRRRRRCVLGFSVRRLLFNLAVKSGCRSHKPQLTRRENRTGRQAVNVQTDQMPDCKTTSSERARLNDVRTSQYTRLLESASGRSSINRQTCGRYGACRFISDKRKPGRNDNEAMLLNVLRLETRRVPYNFQHKPRLPY